MQKLTPSGEVELLEKLIEESQDFAGASAAPTGMDIPSLNDAPAES
jgi:hypothetical protein